VKFSPGKSGINTRLKKIGSKERFARGILLLQKICTSRVIRTKGKVSGERNHSRLKRRERCSLGNGRAK